MPRLNEKAMGEWFDRISEIRAEAMPALEGQATQADMMNQLVEYNIALMAVPMYEHLKLAKELTDRLPRHRGSALAEKAYELAMAIYMADEAEGGG